MTKSCGVYLYFIYIWPINLHFYRIYFHHQCHILMCYTPQNIFFMPGVEERKFNGRMESLVVCHRKKIKKRERERNDGGQREGQKEYLALMITKLKMQWHEFSNVLKGSGVSSSMRLVFLDLRIVAPWCATT